MPIYIDRDDDTTPDIKGVRLSDGTKYEFNYNTLKNKPCFKKDWPPETYLEQIVIPGIHYNPYLTFSSTAPFTIGIDVDYDSRGKGWDGTLEYSDDLETWYALWEGQGPFSPVSSNANNNLYIRGSNNTTFKSDSSGYFTVFIINAIAGVECTGNIETLLDYQTVENGDHPEMSDYCFQSLFYQCTALTTPPELPATTLSNGCYASMFSGCTSLVTLPALPATVLTNSCYSYMFSDCESIMLSATKTGIYTIPYRIPSKGTGSDEEYALEYMFANTGGTFVSTPEINVTYYLAPAQ